jgi:hypothetical protein
MSVSRVGFCLVALTLQLSALCLVDHRVTVGFFGFMLAVGLVTNQPLADQQSTGLDKKAAFEKMEALDEEQIIAEQNGKIIEEYFYSFSGNREEVVGISWTGTKFIASEMAKHGHPITVSETIVEDGGDTYRARAKSKDLATGEERWGFAEQPKADDKRRRNMFAYTIAASKAQRNAIRHFIPEVVIQQGYKEWRKKQGHSLENKGASAQPNNPASPISSPEAEKKPTENSDHKEAVVPVTPKPGSVASVTDEQLATKLDSLDWQVPESKKGWYTSFDSIPQPFKGKLGGKFSELKGTQYVKLGEYSYRRFGDSNEWLARYARSDTIKTEPEPSSPKAQAQEPDASWKVPVSADQATPTQIQQGLRQIPLLKDLRSFGMVNVLNDELSIVPEHPIARNSALIDGFLISRVVEPIANKHQLTYVVKADSNGLLEGILIRGKLSDQHIKELSGGARWAFERALDQKKESSKP